MKPVFTDLVLVEGKPKDNPHYIMVQVLTGEHGDMLGQYEVRHPYFTRTETTFTLDAQALQSIEAQLVAKGAILPSALVM